MMRTIMAAKSTHDSSLSFSRRYLHWKKKVNDHDNDDEETVLNFTKLGSDHRFVEEDLGPNHRFKPAAPRRKKPAIMSVSTLRTALALPFGKSRSRTRVVGTLFGHRRGHVHVGFQADPRSGPVFLVELAAPTSFLVREMASGLVRIALECDKAAGAGGSAAAGLRLLDEPRWRAYCNGKKCGVATRRECGAEEWRVLSSVGPITRGAGVLPPEDGGGNGELMYMRARFERVVGSKDSEAFYMVNPDSQGGPELSIYLIRV